MDLVDLATVSRSSPLSFPSWCDAPRLKDVMVDLRQRRATRRCLRRHPVVGKLILACLSWGFSTALIKIVLDQLTPVDVFGIEILVSAIPLALLAVARGARPSRPDPMLHQPGIHGQSRRPSTELAIPSAVTTRRVRSRRHRCSGRSADASGLCSWALARTPPTLVPYLERGIFERTNS